MFAPLSNVRVFDCTKDDTGGYDAVEEGRLPMTPRRKGRKYLKNDVVKNLKTPN